MTEEHIEERPPFVEIDPFRIDVNPENPRGEHVEETDKHLWPLIESVREFGVLVPLIVKPLEGDEYDYQLIDGERRLHAARSAGLRKVPARVIYERVDEERMRKTMFHIHRYRESWGPLAECDSLTSLYAELLDKYGRSDDPGLLQEFIERTGYYKRTAQDRLRFLRWPLELRKLVYDGEASYWFVIEVESKIIEPASKNFPEYVNDRTIDAIRSRLFEKLEKNVVGRAVAVREAGIIARTSVRPEQKGEARAILERLVQEPTLSFEEARELYLTKFPDAELPPRRGPVALLNDLQRLANELRDYDERYIVNGVGRSRVDIKSFMEALGELSDVLGDVRERILTIRTQGEE